MVSFPMKDNNNILKKIDISDAAPKEKKGPKDKKNGLSINGIVKTHSDI